MAKEELATQDLQGNFDSCEIEVRDACLASKEYSIGPEVSFIFISNVLSLALNFIIYLFSCARNMQERSAWLDSQRMRGQQMKLRRN